VSGFHQWLLHGRERDYYGSIFSKGALVIDVPRAKPTTSWASASLVYSVVGLVTALAFLALLQHYFEGAAASAGVGIVTAFAHIILSASFCLMGVLFGFIALVRIRGDRFSGSRMAWTGIVLGGLPAILLFIAFAQVNAWADIKYQSRMPDPEQVFEVSARQFEWRFRYPVAEQLNKMTTDWKSTGQRVSAEWDKRPQIDDVHVVNEVHTWKGAKVRMYLKTSDVLHSFFLPNLRIKQDALPGKTIPVWYDADETNCKYDAATNSWQFVERKDWELACAELCGWGHFKMRGYLYVHENKEDYLHWLSVAAEKQKN
jgi:heme/copper-type cytochrome/quinol oxidase subunit 2